MIQFKHISPHTVRDRRNAHIIIKLSAVQTRSNIVCVLLRRVFVVLRDVKSNHTRYRDTQINITVLIRDPHNKNIAVRRCMKAQAFRARKRCFRHRIGSETPLHGFKMAVDHEERLFL